MQREGGYAGRGRHLELTAVRLDNAARDGQPKSGALSVTVSLGTCAMEALEDLRQLIGRNRIAVVRHCQCRQASLTRDRDLDETS